jgi:hypothetical protein
LHSLPETVSITGALMLVLVLVTMATQRDFRSMS